MKFVTGMLTALALLLAACGDLPRDARGTLAAARQDTLRVGVLEKPPWTRYDGQVTGVEVELVKRFARELGTEVTWIRGGNTELMSALEHFELHLVIGGVTNKTPWRKKIGLSRPFFTNRFVVGSPDGKPLRSVKGQRVAVPRGSQLAALVRERGAQVVEVSDVQATGTDLVVAPAWQLGALGRKPAGIEVHREKHVMAVPSGENGFLMRLDRFLHGQKSQVAGLLRRENAP